MILQTETLKKLRELINEETQYRKGYEIVAPLVRESFAFRISFKNQTIGLAFSNLRFPDFKSSH